MGHLQHTADSSGHNNQWNSSSGISAGQRFLVHNRTSGELLEWVVESTTVTHSSADWWDLFPWNGHQIEGTDGF